MIQDIISNTPLIDKQRQKVLNCIDMKKSKPKQEKLKEKVKKTTRNSIEEVIKEIAKSEGIISAIGDGIRILDKTFKVLYDNQVHKDMMGDHVGEYCYKAYKKQDSICSGCPVALTFEKGKIYTVQREIRLDKETRYLEITASPLRDEKGAIIAGIEIIRDITESKKSKELLISSEKTFRSMVECLPLGMFVYQLYDDQLIFMNANPAAEKILGVDCTDFIGKTIEEAFLPLAETEIPAMYRRAATTGMPWSSEYISYEHGKIKGAYEVNAFQMSPNNVGVLFADVTERKKMEETLKERDELLQLQFNRMPIGCITWDVNFRVIAWNPAAKKIFGFTEEEAKGKHPYGLIVPKEVQPKIDIVWQRLLEGDAAAHSVNENITKDGRVIICSWSNTPLRITDGSIIGVMSMVQDITERKKAEDALRENEEKLESIFRTSPSGIGVVSSPDRILLKVNERLCKMLGYSNEDLVGKSARVIYPTDKDFEYVGKRKYELIKEHGVGTVETRWQCRDGRIIDVILSSSPIDRNNLSLGLTFTALDITEKKYAEEALKKSKQQIHMLLDSTAEAIYGIDLEGNCTFVNAAFLRILGYDNQNKLLGKNMHDLIHFKYPDGSVYPKEKCKVFQAFRRGERINVDDEVLWKADGTGLPVEYWSYPIKQEGKVIGAVVTFIDITERKKAEEMDHMRTDQIILNKEALLELTRMQTPDLATFSKIITLMTSQVLGVERVSVWFYNNVRSEIICEALYILSNHSHEKGFRLRAKDYPEYFKALEEDPVLAADDAHTDPRTNELAGQYLKPLGIFSMMDIPIRRRGKVIGVMCYESIESRQWTHEDQHFATSVAHIVTSALEDFERKKTAEALKASEQELTKRVKDLEDFYQMAVGRELRMKELKGEIAELKEELEKYKSK